MRFPFEPRWGLIVAGAEVWGPKGSVTVRLAVDTGSLTSVLTSRVLRSIGYDPHPTSDMVIVATASRMELVPRIIVQRLGAYGLEQSEFPILCHDLPPAVGTNGLLGLDFFRSTSLHIDFQTGYIEVSP